MTLHSRCLFTRVLRFVLSGPNFQTAEVLKFICQEGDKDGQQTR